MEEVSTKINGRELILKTGKFAHQANGSVFAQMGETCVLVTVVSAQPREDIDYFPLFVEYQEKLYAGGKIKGSRWVKREGRPSDEAILNARLIDRSIRPLFPQDYKNEVQVVSTILSVDGENNPDTLSISAASAALAISDIPWQGPVGAVRVGLKDNDFFINPTYQEAEFSDLDLVVSGNGQEIIMIEAGANEVPEEKILGALNYSQEFIEKTINLIQQLVKKAGRKKQSFRLEKTDPDLQKEVAKQAGQEITELLNQKDGQAISFRSLEEMKTILAEKIEDRPKKEVGQAIDQLFKERVRKKVLEKKQRIDGRKPEEIRPLAIEVGVLPRTHGSAIFKRGLTQALTITTLGSPSLEQLIENMEGEETKRYIHHYYMPPYSVGETGRFGWPSRREVGHGSLAERALMPLIPAEDKFPYTIRVVSEITSSNGSTSMASVCGSSLSLMDAGVPIKKAVAGIAMGLMAKKQLKASAKKAKLKKQDCVILTDILGIEDHLGDMDFKVAGTEEGVTAMQMDVKTRGITAEILADGLVQARKARLFILEKMKKALASPREKISKHAPKIELIHINPEKIGEVIGPGGKMIRKIINQTGVAMDVDDDGTVTIAGKDPIQVQKAIDWIESLTREVKAGETFKGPVRRIMNFGAFVEILPGKKGLVHISELSPRYIKHPSEVVQEGQEVKVKVKEIDKMGRINLTMVFDERKPISKITHQRK